MRLSDRLVKQNEQKEKRRKSFVPEDEEDTYTYQKRGTIGDLNGKHSGVFQIADETAINRMESIFDRTAIFRTDGK